MKTMRKISALVLAIMIIAMVGIAWAETTTQGGVQVDDAATSFTINKEIVLFNTDGSAIYEPNVTYTYTLTGVNPSGATITDNPATTKYDSDADHSVTVTVKQGRGGVTIQAKDKSGNLVDTAAGVNGTTTVTFGDTSDFDFETNTEGAIISASSKVASRDIVVTIDPTSTAFKDSDGVYVPGVYRYHIAETANTAEANGVKLNSNRVTDLTLDVYLRWNSGRTGLEVYGYVLFKGLTETENLSYSSTTASTAKVTGFDVESSLVTDSAGSTTATADEYHTYNTTVSKTVSGNLADTNNAFPFAIAMTGISSTEFYWTRTGRTVNATTLTMGTGANISSDLKHDETIKITGLPYDATVQVTESNNTFDNYSPSATFTAGSGTATDITSDLTITNNFVAANPDNTAATVAYKNGKVTTQKTLTDALTEDVIAFTNTLKEISPTGYVSRFAPYALILVGGIVLLVIAKKRKTTKDEEE